jgi:hypothetical protein
VIGKAVIVCWATARKTESRDSWASLSGFGRENLARVGSFARKRLKLRGWDYNLRLVTKILFTGWVRSLIVQRRCRLAAIAHGLLPGNARSCPKHQQIILRYRKD